MRRNLKKPTRRPGCLGDTVYWFDTPQEEVVLEKAARRADPSSGSARSAAKSYISRLFSPRKYQHDWQARATG